MCTKSFSFTTCREEAVGPAAVVEEDTGTLDTGQQGDVVADKGIHNFLKNVTYYFSNNVKILSKGNEKNAYQVALRMLHENQTNFFLNFCFLKV